MNISQSNIFLNILLAGIFYQNSQAVLAVASINGLTMVRDSNQLRTDARSIEDAVQ